MKKELRAKITDGFRERLFDRLLKKFGTVTALAKEFNIPRATMDQYKSKRIDSFPLPLLRALSGSVGIPKRELREAIIETTTLKEIMIIGLKKGWEFRRNQFKKWREEIPKVEEIIENNSLNVEKWFKHYRKLIDFGVREFKSIRKDGNKLLLRYTCYSNGKKKEFNKILPARINIDKEFQYFFGLWCGDNSGKGRIGVINKETSINLVTASYLKKLYQNPKFVLVKGKGKGKTSNLKVKIDETWECENRNGYGVSVHCINGILETFFRHLNNNLDKFLDTIPNENIFFAGLFDAEGNVFFEDECFRWSCLDEEKVKIYKKHLKKLKLFHRYDGANLVTYNVKAFSTLILPYLKHKTKIEKANVLCNGGGKLGDRFKSILKIIENNPGITSSNLAKKLGLKKTRSQLRFLDNYEYINREGYPPKAYITQKGLNEIGG